MTETELQEIEKRRDAANQVVDDLCHGRRDWIMHVPARMDSDPDLVIAAALRDNTALLSTVRELQRQVQKREADARRYRWIRDAFPTCNLTMTDYNDKLRWIFGTPMLDDAIDAALNKEPIG